MRRSRCGTASKRLASAAEDLRRVASCSRVLWRPSSSLLVSAAPAAATRVAQLCLCSVVRAGLGGSQG